MIKARAVAGDIELGGRFIEMAHSFVFSPQSPAEVCQNGRSLHKANVRQMKERIESQLKKTSKGDQNVKLGVGGIRDVEFIVQYLQLEHGGECAAIRCHNTLTSLRLLEENGFLDRQDRGRLEDAYKFLRKVEHRLQLMHELQVSAIPSEDAEIAKLALRMGFSNDESGVAGEKFLDAYRMHTESVRGIFNKILS